MKRLNQATRLFDLFAYLQNEFATTTLLSGKDQKGKWQHHPLDVLPEVVDALSSGFLDYGIQTNDKVAIIANNSPQWLMVELALMQIGAITVPMVPNGATRMYQQYIDKGQVKFCIVSNQTILDALPKTMEGGLTFPKNNIISIDAIEGITDIDTLINKGKEIGIKKALDIEKQITPDQIATMVCWEDANEQAILVPLSHQALMDSIYASKILLSFKQQEDAFSYLSLSSMFERTMVYTYLFSGCTVHFPQNQQSILEDIKEVQPHYMTAQTAFLMKIYSQFLASKTDLSEKKQARFDKAVQMAKEWKSRDRALSYDIKLNIYRQLSLKGLRKNLGKNLKGILVHTETIPANLSQLFHAAGIPIRQYYGIPQVPIFTLDRFHEDDSFPGTVGRALPGIQVKINENKQVVLKTNTIKDWIPTNETGEFIEDKYLKLNFSSSD